VPDRRQLKKRRSSPLSPRWGAYFGRCVSLTESGCRKNHSLGEGHRPGFSSEQTKIKPLEENDEGGVGWLGRKKTRFVVGGGCPFFVSPEPKMGAHRAFNRDRGLPLKFYLKNEWSKASQ